MQENVTKVKVAEVEDILHVSQVSNVSYVMVCNFNTIAFRKLPLCKTSRRVLLNSHKKILSRKAQKSGHQSLVCGPSTQTSETSEPDSIVITSSVAGTDDVSQLLLEGLPPLPAKPKYPCPHLSDEEVMTYLAPLYLRGWGVIRKKTAVHGTTKRPLFLIKKFSFKSFDHLMLFVNDMVQVIQNENVRVLFDHAFRYHIYLDLVA